MQHPLPEPDAAAREHSARLSSLIREQIAAYTAVGVEELMLQWFDLDDIGGLHALAETVLPHLPA